MEHAVPCSVIDQRAPEHPGNVRFLLADEKVFAQLNELVQRDLAVAVFVDHRKRNGCILFRQPQTAEEQFELVQRDRSRAILVDGLTRR